MEITQIWLTLVSGGLVGIILGLVGGGGSILAVPLLIFLVGVSSTHVAIGTGAVAVAVNAFAGLWGQARAGMIKWPCALVFSAAGAVGAAIGAYGGKSVDGDQLLILFGLLMIVVAIATYLRRNKIADLDVRLSRGSAPKLLPPIVGGGLLVGLAAGFFGIGGGFLIVPALMAATGMSMRQAVGTSLVVVTVLGATTALSYAMSGLVDWKLSLLLITGGVAGAWLGLFLGKRLANRKGRMEMIFAMLVLATGIYIVLRSTGLIFSL
ncbi:sulfite exporter TauE/SafE family protein [Parasphingorhabdus sp.]|uniref:sulfite exporter TauE/SafE family protein n=1 Tax=Parasphingorhabdus sp. TaxID=2709688 RepID=UPI003265443E